MVDALNAVGRFHELPAEVYVYRFPYWKWPIVRQCFPGVRVKFTEHTRDIPSGAWFVLWGTAAVPDSLASNINILRMEDGFLRSVGLGADLVRPVSWVIDRLGIYYDATCPSDLEVLLETAIVDDQLVARASALRLRIVNAGITKYNVGGDKWIRSEDDERVILVPGQVESDASLAFGSPLINTNVGLLRAVREANPEAYIVYKPHPDVVAKLRAQGTDEKNVSAWCDEIVADVAMGYLLDKVDEVHVMTSLAGFEALLRRKKVICYGQPFYSGWGLTRDVIANPRRSRRLTVEELVALALIIYPLYMSRKGKRLVTPEQALEELILWRDRAGESMPWWRTMMRFFLRRFIGVR